MITQDLKKEADYLSLGITCNILKSELPCFIWNTDEKNIVSYPLTHEVVNGMIQIKPGNVWSSVRTYTELNEDIISEINSSYGIVILEKSELCQRSARIDYRFAIVN